VIKITKRITATQQRTVSSLRSPTPHVIGRFAVEMAMASQQTDTTPNIAAKVPNFTLLIPYT
jgi:hypothetical protein